jgi:hypothetical protein
MKPKKILHVILAGIGCASLLVYILACSTSFSPDDSQVLYPSFEKNSGAVSIAVYDRKTGRSEELFTALAPSEDVTNQDLQLARAQWLDGKHVLVAHVLPDQDKDLALLVLPRGVNEPVRHLPLAGLKSAAETLEFPFCVAGSRVYLADEKKLAWIDYRTGQTRSADTTNCLFPLLGSDGKTIVGVSDVNDKKEELEVGIVDPETLAFTRTLTLTNSFGEGGLLPSFDPRNQRAIYVAGEGTNLHLQVQKPEGVELDRLLTPPGARVMVGPWLDLGPRGDRVFAGYIRLPEGAEEAEYGVVEIPLSREPLRWIPLFRAKPAEDGDLLYAQGSLSHDGQTWAVCTSYLYLENKSVKAEDCALYLVEVGQTKPKVTKVPITPPANRRELVHK